VSKRLRREGAGRKGGATMMVWMFFANLFEPRKVAAMEQIDTQRRIGTESQRAVAAGRPADAPLPRPTGHSTPESER